MTDKPRSFPSVPDWEVSDRIASEYPRPLDLSGRLDILDLPQIKDPDHEEWPSPRFTLPDDEPDPSWHRTRHDDIDTRKAVAVVATGLVCFAVGLLIGAAL